MTITKNNIREYVSLQSRFILSENDEYIKLLKEYIFWWDLQILVQTNKIEKCMVFKSDTQGYVKSMFLVKFGEGDMPDKTFYKVDVNLHQIEARKIGKDYPVYRTHGEAFNFKTQRYNMFDAKVVIFDRMENIWQQINTR